MKVLAESEQYIVFAEYESVIMEIKRLNKKIQIGDFYGEPQKVLISKEEKFCVMCGCGIIIYYLEEPFKEYEYNTQTKQWREWGRNNVEKVVWVDNIKCIGDEIIEVITEDGNTFKIDVYN